MSNKTSEIAKKYSLILIFFLLTFDNSFAMDTNEIDPQYDLTRPITSQHIMPRQQDVEERTPINPSHSRSRECCPGHWGLSHWLSGITEYFQRCFCCGVPEDNERAFVLTQGGHIAQSSDCFILGVTQLGTCCCDNPIGGYFMLPRGNSSPPLLSTFCLLWLF